MKTDDKIIDWILKNEAGSFPVGALIKQNVVTRDELEVAIASLVVRGFIYRDGFWPWPIGPYKRERYRVKLKLRDRWHDAYPV